MTRRRRTQRQGWAAARHAVGEEVARVAMDERDRAEMRAIREQLAALAPGRATQTSSSA